MSLDPATVTELEDFLLLEADLLDSRRFEDWNKLYAPDAVYWMPSEPDQKDHLTAASIIYDDAQCREARVRRLQHPRNRVEETPTRTLRTVQNIQIREIEPDVFATKYRLIVVELRAGVQRIFAGLCHHRLERRDGKLSIASKKVELLNCDEPLPIISVPL